MIIFVGLLLLMVYKGTPQKVFWMAELLNECCETGKIVAQRQTAASTEEKTELLNGIHIIMNPR